MNLMEVAVFDIIGDFACFRAFETTRGNFSFPFPPRTALIGLIAGILGLEYNTYWNDHPLSSSLIGIEVLSPIKRKGVKLNFIQSRKTMKISDVEILLPKDPSDPDSRGFSTQVRLDLLRNVHYRVFFLNDNENIFSSLCNSIQKHQYMFPPYLGHANLLCQIDWIGKFPANVVKTMEITTSCLIPTSLVKSNGLLEAGMYTVVYQVPMEYKAEPLEIPALKQTKYLISTKRYDNVIYQEKNIDSPIKVELTKNQYAFDVQDNDKGHSIICFPNC